LNHTGFESRLSFSFPSLAQSHDDGRGGKSAAGKQQPVWSKAVVVASAIGSTNQFFLFGAAARAFADTRGSELREIIVGTCDADVAPFASASLMVCLTRSGPSKANSLTTPVFPSREGLMRERSVRLIHLEEMSDSLIHFPQWPAERLSGTC